MGYEFTAELWRWEVRASDGWTFVSLPQQLADEIEEVARPVSRGFGSVRVEVSLGATTWQTSLFPDSTAGTYVLPIKKAVRTAEGLGPGSHVHVRLRLLDA
ncbi:MAG TPA: DUF1905 domain-containing protein [Actinotalea sp.]|nr:DUF1905 domain-containing protein [Actinotalea sp.]